VNLSLRVAPLSKKSAMAARPKAAPRQKIKTFDDYLAALAPKQRAALERLRVAIQAAAPEAEECISYGLAAFRLDGKPLVALGATANHCAFYLMSGATVAQHADLLVGYDTSKGTIRFAPDRPLPATLVRKLVRARIAENSSKASTGHRASQKQRQKKRSASNS
jgi:uncharacterized protein YdhG (YjbR/CyaY superfamily)